MGQHNGFDPLTNERPAGACGYGPECRYPGDCAMAVDLGFSTPPSFLELLACALGTDVDTLVTVAAGNFPEPVRLVSSHPGTGGAFILGTLADYRAVEALFFPPPSPPALTVVPDVPDAPKRGRHVVYRLFDQDDRLLYVGSTRNWLGRLKAHRRKWGDLIARTTTEEYDDAESMLEAEAAAIHDEKPALNAKGIV